MNIKNFALATLAGGVGVWALSVLWQNLIVQTLYVNETEASHEGIGILIVAYLVLGFWMVYSYPHRYQRRR